METQQLHDQTENDSTVEETDIAHLAGVIDAIGRITVHISKDNEYKVGYHLHPVVQIHQPISENDPLIGKLMSYSDEYGVRFSLSEKTRGEDESGSYVWLCKDPESIERFLEPMVPYLVSNYDRARLMLEEITPRVEAGDHTDKQGFYELMEYADLLRGEEKYNQDYFREEWSLSE